VGGAAATAEAEPVDKPMSKRPKRAAPASDDPDSSPSAKPSGDDL
jgi:hypothetical protein